MALCRQPQAITWANADPDLCHYMLSQGANDLVNALIKYGRIKAFS